jgi:hypothetical protein
MLKCKVVYHNMKQMGRRYNSRKIISEAKPIFMVYLWTQCNLDLEVKSKGSEKWWGTFKTKNDRVKY